MAADNDEDKTVLHLSLSVLSLCLFTGGPILAHVQLQEEEEASPLRPRVEVILEEDLGTTHSVDSYSTSLSYRLYFIASLTRDSASGAEASNRRDKDQDEQERSAAQGRRAHLCREATGPLEDSLLLRWRSGTRQE